MSKEQIALLVLSLSIGLSLAVDICDYQMDGVRLAHPADCNKFVECQNGKTYRILSCPLALHFNRFKGVCDLRQRAACDMEFVNFLAEETNCSACCALYGCYVNPECPQTSETPTTVTSPTNTAETLTTSATSPATATTNIPETDSPSSTTNNPDTPATTSSTEASSSPVTTFTSTTAESSTEHPGTLSTSKPTSSSPTTDIPDTPATSTSSQTTASSETPNSSSSPETSSPPFTPASPETPATPDIPTINQCPNSLIVCQNKTDNSVMHVNGTCNQYIVCVAGCAYVMSCPANLQYDIARRECDYPQNVNCPWQSTTAITGPSGVSCAHHGQCEKQSDGKLFADPNSDGYIICQCECEIERRCPVGTKFDAKLLTCAWKANNTFSGNSSDVGKNYEIANADKVADDGGNTISTVCLNNVEICRNQGEGKLFAVDGVCNKFYQCRFGCALEILCPNNLVYNPQAKRCDYPYNYKCPWPLTAPSAPSAGPCGIACASGGRCVGKSDGTLFPSLTSCAKYVVCQCACEVERNCAKNLYWDENSLTCNYAGNVTCELN